MQFLKQKAVSVYQYSKDFIRRPPKPSEMNGKTLIQWLLTHLYEETDPLVLQRLACLSTEFQEYTEIFNNLIEKLQEFTYTPKGIQQTLKLLNTVVYLIRSGSEEFSNDFGKNQDLLQTLTGLDVHKFENCIGLKDAKTLTYKLELIRHRAIFIRKLIASAELRQEERAKNGLPLSVLEEYKGKPQGDETINGLKIDVSFDKPTNKRNNNKSLKQNKPEQPSGHSLSAKPIALPKAGQALGNKIANQICT